MSDPRKQRLDEVLAELTESPKIVSGDVRALALATLTELFLEGCRGTGTGPPAHFAEIVTGLLPRVPLHARAEVSRQLAHSDAVPDAVVRLLVEDDPEVAGPMLRQSPLLADDALLRVAHAAPLEKARAIAGRADLGRNVIAALIARGDALIGAALSHAPELGLEPREADRIAALPGLPASAAERLIDVAELSDEALARLFWLVDRTGRARVLDRLARRRESLPVDPAKLNAANPQDRRDGSALLAHAAAGRAEAVRDSFAAALEVSPELAARLVDDPGGEPLTVAGRAAGLSLDQITGVVLLTCPAAGTSYEALRALVDLAERLPAPVAHHMVGLWRRIEAPAPRHVHHEPAVARPGTHARHLGDSHPGRLAEEADRLVGDKRGG